MKKKQKFLTRDEINHLADVQQHRLDGFIASLGDSEQEIARRLRRMKIKGVPGDNGRCALAEALRREFGIEDVSVGGGYDISVDGFEAQPQKNADAVNEFVGKFDDEAYPALIKSYRKPKAKATKKSKKK